MAPKKKKYFSTINPSNEKKIAEIAYADKSDVDLAVDATRKAYDGVWSKITPSERAKYIYRIARIMQERSRELAVIESLDGGKLNKRSQRHRHSLGEQSLFYNAGWADKLEYAFAKTAIPLGVAGPNNTMEFSFIDGSTWKIAPALAAGNTVVLKPAETTSLTALKLAEIIPSGSSARSS